MVGPVVGITTLLLGDAVPYVIGGVTMVLACGFAVAFVVQPRAAGATAAPLAEDVRRH